MQYRQYPCGIGPIYTHLRQRRLHAGPISVASVVASLLQVFEMHALT